MAKAWLTAAEAAKLLGILTTSVAHAGQRGMVWRPALVATVGVQFLPGFKDKE